MQIIENKIGKKCSRQQVLIVDDDSVDLRLLAGILKGEAVITTCDDPRQAVALALRIQPDLILLDVHMPAIDGYSLSEALMDMPETRDAPVIFITADTGVSAELRALEAGAIDFISKPFMPAVVRMRVRNHLRLKACRDDLAHLSRTDALTGIANRRWFDETLQREWQRALRGNEPISLIMADIDHFKKYNDRYGHLQGDHCLRSVARALAHPFRRPTDLVARFGGEEFCCLLPGTTEHDALAMAEQARAAVAALDIEHMGSGEGRVTLSLGVAGCVPVEPLNAHDLLAEADNRLYRAKRAGRNQACGTWSFVLPLWTSGQALAA